MFSPSVEVKLKLVGLGHSLLVVLKVAAETAATQRISNRAFISDRFIICFGKSYQRCRLCMRRIKEEYSPKRSPRGSLTLLALNMLLELIFYF